MQNSSTLSSISANAAHSASGLPPSFARNLSNWYHSHHRSLPWRREPSLYKTVLSEFMLQQTQVTTVLPYFARWLQKFPTFEALAAAPEAAVLKQWEGLGYYSRARNLHKLAQAYTQADPKPQTAAAWRCFPGIGPYTSAAIASIAHGESVAVVDGNVIRILTRLTANDTAFKNSTTALKSLTPLATQIIATAADPGIHNQAMMELGATVCTKHKPLCLLCPVRPYCAAQRAGTVEAYPNLQRSKTVRRQVDRIFALRDGHVLLHRMPANAKRLANMCELPDANLLGICLDGAEYVGKKKRGISNEQITENIYAYQPDQSVLQQIEHRDDFIWADITIVDTYTLSGPHRKWLNELLASVG